MVEGLAAVQSLFTSALEYHAQVPDQRDATLEPQDAGYASRGTIPPTPDVVIRRVTGGLHLELTTDATLKYLTSLT